MIPELAGKNVGIVGYGGREGRAVCAYLQRRGASPTLLDKRPWERWSADERREFAALGLPTVFGPGYLDELGTFDVLFRSPGVPFMTSELQAFRARGGELTSQTKFFFDRCRAPIIGVTGTNGKGTTATLVHDMLRAAGTAAHLTGNIGATDPLEILEGLQPDGWVIFELSSFQLQDMGVSPKIAVVLTVTEDHLDHHRDLAEYVSAKEHLTRYQKPGDVAVYLKDNPVSAAIGLLGAGVKKTFSRRDATADCAVVDGWLTLRTGGEPERLVNVSELLLRGEHNWENAAAAALAASAAGCGAGSITETLRSFRGLDHRLQFVGTRGGVSYYDDSIATTPDPTIAAIRSFSEPLVVILGGSTKGSDFTKLGAEIAARRNVKAVVVVGAESERISGALRQAGSTAPVRSGAATMAEIFVLLGGLVSPGDVVLLSPACASFGMFKNYKDRGDQFRAAVDALAEGAA